MLKVDCLIEIGEWSFNSAVSVDITTDLDTLTDLCTIVIPRKFQWQGRPIAVGLEPVFKRNDKVVVKYGYDGNLNTEFIGYVKNIKSGLPVTIECEDSMLLLKQGKDASISYPSDVKLSKLLEDILPPGMEFHCSDTRNPFRRYTGVNAAQILEELRKRGIFSQFRLITSNGITRSVLYVGLYLWPDNKTEVFEFGHNIIETNLVYRNADDVRLLIKAIGIGRDNKRIEIEVGDKDGQKRTIHLHNADEAELRAYALRYLTRFKYSGFSGSFLTFGEPSVQKGDVAEIRGTELDVAYGGTRQQYPEKPLEAKRYYIKKVTKRLSVQEGIKQIIEPGGLSNANPNT